MPYQPTNPYPYNTAIDLDDGLQFRFKADNYDVITSFEIELYDLLKNKKLYTIVRCLGEISDNTIIKGNEQLLQIFDENNEQIYLDYFTKDCGTFLPLKSKRNGLNIGRLDLSKFLATIEQLEKQKYYPEVDNAENLTITNSEAFVINEEGIIVEYLPYVLSEEEQTNLVIPYEIIRTVEGVTTKTKVRGIASGVFSETSLLQSIIIPSCVIAIGDDNESSVGAFEECSNLTKVTFNYGVTKIGANTFKKCSALQQINLLDSISEIGTSVFQDCSNLTYITLPSELKEIKANCFNGTGLSIVNLPEYVSYIGSSAFANCKNLININMDKTSSLREIGNAAFANCVKLSGENVQENAVETQKFSIVEGVQKIDDMAFNGCSNLKIVELPKSLLEIGEQVFSRCCNITQIILPFVGEKRENNITTHSVFGYIFGNSDLSGKFDDNNKDLYNTRITYSIYYIPNSLTTVTITDQQILPIGAFQDCQYIEKVNLSNVTEQISDYCFALCSNLKSFVCPTYLTTIGKSAFAKQGSVLLEESETTQNANEENNVEDITNENNFNISFKNIANTHDLKIGEYAFAFREDIVNLDLPDFTSEIGESAFYKAFVSNVNNTISLTMPYLNPKNGFEGLFRNKDNTTEIIYPLGLTKIIINKVKDNIIEENSFNINANIKNNIQEIELPDEVTSIGANAFHNIKFTTFTMPFNIKSIGSGAFNFVLTEENKEPTLYWTTLLDKNSEIARKSKNDLFGEDLTSCYGNKGVTIATEEKNAQIYNPVDGDTISEETQTIIIKKTGETVNFSAPACLFGINNITPVSGSCGDNLVYEIIENTLNIKGYGAMWDFEPGTAPWYGKGEAINNLNLPNLTSIGNYAFYKLKLTSINWSALTQSFSIGEHAFDGTMLTTLTLPSNIIEMKQYAFANIYSLNDIVIPSTLKITAASLFYGCENVISISTPVSELTNLGALWGNSWKPTVEMNENLAKKDYELKYNCFGVPCSLKKIEIVAGSMGENFLNAMSDTWLFNGYRGKYNGRIAYRYSRDEYTVMEDKILLYDEEFEGYLSAIKYDTIKIKKGVKLNQCCFGYCYMDNLIIEDMESLYFSLNIADSRAYYIAHNNTITSLFTNFTGDYNACDDKYNQGSRHDFNYAPLTLIRFKQIKIGGEKKWSGDLLGINGALTDADKTRESALRCVTCPLFAKDGILDLSETNLTSQDIKDIYYKPSGEIGNINLYYDVWILGTLNVSVDNPNLINPNFGYITKDYSRQTYEQYLYSHASKISHSIKEIKLPLTCQKIIPYMFDVFSEVEIISGNNFSSKVSEYGLYGLTNLCSINISSTPTTELFVSAFQECKNLNIDYYIGEALNIPVNTFKNCQKMRIHFCNNLTNIGDYAFYNCKFLNNSGKGITTSTKLGKWSFYNCERFSLPTNYSITQNLSEGVFFGCVNLLSLFSIKKLLIEEGVQNIGSYALGKCNLTEIVFPDSIVQIGENALYDYKGKSIVLPFTGMNKRKYDCLGYNNRDTDASGACAMIFCFLFKERCNYSSSFEKSSLYNIISDSELEKLEDKSVTTPRFVVWSSNDSNETYCMHFAWPDNLTTIYFNNGDTLHQLRDTDNKLNPYAFYGAKSIQHTYFKTLPSSIGSEAYTGATATKPELWIETSKLKKTSVNQLSNRLVSVSYTSYPRVPLFLSREKEYYWNIKLLGDKYDVYITDNDTYTEENSYLPTIYAPNYEGVEPEQQITIQGENKYLIDKVETFKNEGKIYYRQSKGIMSGQLSYYGVANGTLTYSEDTQVYTVDQELFNVLPTEPVKFSTGSKYSSDTYVGTIHVQNGKVIVKLDNETEHSRFEFGAAIALQNTIITQGSLPEGLLNVVKEGTAFTVSTDGSVQTVSSINDYFNITFTPGIKNTTSGYTNVQMTLADKDKSLILPNSLTTKQVLIVINTIGDITMEGKKEEEIKQAKVDENLLALMIAEKTIFLLDGKEYIVKSIDKKNQTIIFSDASERGYVLPEERDKKQKIRLVSNYVDLASKDFDITNLVLTLNYINIYTVNKIEDYAYTKENEYQIPTEDGEKLYLVTCNEVVNPTNFEVNDRTLEKNALLERQSMILTVKSVDETAMPHLLVEGDSYYSIYSNCIKSPSYYFRTLNKEPVLIKCNNKNVIEDIVDLNGSSATFVAETDNNVSYYVWELYEYYIDDYILMDKKTDKYSSTIFYDYHMFKDNVKYKLKLTIVTKEGLNVIKEIIVNVAFSKDLILQGAFVEKDCLRQAIAIDLQKARFRYKIPKVLLSGTLSYNKTDKKFTVDENLKKLLSSSPLKFSIGNNFDDNYYRGVISLQEGQIQVTLKEDMEKTSQENSKDTEQKNKYSEFENGSIITLQDCYSVCYICPFSKEESTKILDVYGTVKGFYVIRAIKDEPDTSVVVGYVNGFISRFYDYSYQREETYEYSIVPIFNPAGTNTDNEEELVRGIAYKIKPYIRFNTQIISVIGTKTNFNTEDTELTELENCYMIDDSEFGSWYFKLNAEDKNVTVVTDKTIFENDYRFPSVNQTDRNYKTGSITVMLGNYYQNEDKQWSYKDSIRLQNKFQEFANNGKVKMLRDEIGNVLPVDITLKSFDYLPQAIPTSISVTFEWTQINSEDKLGVYDYRKAKELDKIYVLPFNTREEVLNKPLEVQGLYFESGRRMVPSKELKLTGQGVEYNETTGYITLTNKAPKQAFTVTIEDKNDKTIKTTFVIPANE